MSPEFPRPTSQAASRPEVISRRWRLAKRADDGRPLLVRDDRVVRPSGLAARSRRSTSAQTDGAGGTPAFT